MLQLATQYREQVVKFMGSNQIDACKTLVDILLRHEVCRSSEERRAVIVPALIHRGILTSAPDTELTATHTEELNTPGDLP
jgi:hypothetical protein